MGLCRLLGTAAILALILLLPGTAGAARHVPPRELHVEVVSCLTGSPGVAERLGCGTVAGAGERDSALANVTALAVELEPHVGLRHRQGQQLAGAARVGLRARARVRRLLHR